MAGTSGEKLLDPIRDAVRLRHCSQGAGQAQVQRIMRHIYLHDGCHPAETGGPRVEAFLTHLAISDKDAASTENEALSALFLDGSQPELIPAPTAVVAGLSTNRL